MSKLKKRGGQDKIKTMKNQKTKFYIHNFDGNLIGPEEGAIDYSAPELRHMAYEFASEDDAKEARERLLGAMHGGVVSENELDEPEGVE